MQKILSNDNEYCEYEYVDEAEFEKDIVDNAKKIFGNKTIYIDVKKLIKAKYKNSSIPET